MDEVLERVWTRWCARRVLHLWDAPEAVRTWLDTGDEVLREEALEAANAARTVAVEGERTGVVESAPPVESWAFSVWASSVWTAALAVEASSGEDADLAADEALGALASLAVDEATDEANAAWDAEASRARAAGWMEAEVEDAAADAAWDAAWDAADAAVDAESSAQQRTRDLITTLATLLPEHGLSALRIDDEALEDRWLTREVWRALGLPDLQVVCDWAEVTR